MPTAKVVREKLFTGIASPGNLEDSLLNLLLLVVNSASPGADVVTYLKSIVDGRDDLAVSYVEHRLHDATDQIAKQGR